MRQRRTDFLEVKRVLFLHKLSKKIIFAEGRQRFLVHDKKKNKKIYRLLCSTPRVESVLRRCIKRPEGLEMDPLVIITIDLEFLCESF